jgi:hypothetical protein
VLEISLLESAYRNGNGEDDVLLNTARRYRIDVEKVQKDVVQEFATKQKKKEQKTAPSKTVA